jgi:hypothetical protein
MWPLGDTTYIADMVKIHFANSRAAIEHRNAVRKLMFPDNVDEPIVPVEDAAKADAPAEPAPAPAEPAPAPAPAKVEGAKEATEADTSPPTSKRGWGLFTWSIVLILFLCAISFLMTHEDAVEREQEREQEQQPLLELLQLPMTAIRKMTTGLVPSKALAGATNAGAGEDKWMEVLRKKN